MEKLKEGRPRYAPEITLEKIFELPAGALKIEDLERADFLAWL